jgi:glycosyltransferase involved in cell wall biosynthesis
MIRVLHVLSSLNGGGVENLLLNYYKNMKKGDIKFDFIVQGNDKGLLEPIFEELNSKVYHIPSKHDSLLNNLSSMKSIISNGNYDVVHAHQGVMSVFPLYYAYKAGVDIRIAHSHLAYIKKSIFRRQIDNMLKVFLKKYSNYWFACSLDAGKSLWGERAVKNNKVYIMKNAINIDKFTYNWENRSRKRKELKVEDRFVIGSIGRFTYQKNHKYLIEIFNEVYKRESNTVLLLVGTGELENEIKEQVKKLGLKDAVKFLGVRTDVHEIMQAMDIFLLPSRYEGLGIVYVEAQASGLVTFASDKVVPSEAKSSELMHFVSLQRSPQYWANEILKYKYEYVRKDMSCEIKKNGYDVKQEAQKLEDFYLQKTCRRVVDIK